MPVSRRNFIATSAATLASVSMANVHQAIAAGSKPDLRVAVVGVKSRGKAHIGGVGKNLVALCDVDTEILKERASDVKAKLGRSVETFSDYRKLVERKDIDAISIATPNHTHSLIAIAAIQAGKDVYVEKPISHNIWEGRQLVAATEKSGRIVQCGTQSRSSTALQEAVKFVHSKQLGEIQYAVGTCYKKRSSIGKLDKPLVIPASLDYDAWCGPAEKRELMRSRVHYDWHWDFNTGNGDMGNQGIHQMDIARWFLGEDKLAPRVISIGGRLGYDDAGDTPNTQVVYQDYAKAPLIFETRGLPRSREGQQKDWAHSMDTYRGSRIGVIVQCEGGYVLIPPTYKEAYAYDHRGKLIKEWHCTGTHHHDNWLAAVAAQDRSMLNADVVEGHLSSSLCHTGAISHQLGEKSNANKIAEYVKGDPLLSSSFDRMASHLRANDVDIDSKAGELTIGPWLEIDPTTEQFTNNEAASKLFRRAQQREPFAVPDVENS